LPGTGSSTAQRKQSGVSDGRQDASAQGACSPWRRERRDTVKGTARPPSSHMWAGPGKRSAQARIAAPGRRRQPSAARERWKPAGERPVQRGSMRSTTARPATQWPETPLLWSDLCWGCALADFADNVLKASSAW